MKKYTDYQLLLFSQLFFNCYDILDQTYDDLFPFIIISLERFLESPYNVDTKSEYDCMVEFIDNYDFCAENLVTAEELQEEQKALYNQCIDLAKVNITTCGNCGAVQLMKVATEHHTCSECLTTSDVSNFPDLY